MAADPSPAAHRPGYAPTTPAGQPSQRPRPDLRVVGRPRHRGRYFALLSLVGAVGVFGVVSLHALAAEAAFEAQTLEAEVSELSMRYEELTAEVAALEAPERIRDVATEELGMVPVEEPAFLSLEAQTADAPTASTGTPGDASRSAEAPLADPLKQFFAAGG